MSYDEKMELVKQELITYCKNLIKNHNNGWLDMWLDIDARFEICPTYITIFKKHFDHYIDNDLEHFLRRFGSNLIYGIRAFIKTNKEEYVTNKVIKFIELFITYQLEDFHNSNDSLLMAFPDHSDETETQNNEDNPV